MLIKNQLILTAQTAIEQVAYQFLTLFAVHCLKTSVVPPDSTRITPGDYGTTSSGLCSIKGRLRSIFAFKRLGTTWQLSVRPSEPESIPSKLFLRVLLPEQPT